MPYKVYSPNSKSVKCRLFENEQDAFHYYSEQLAYLMYLPHAHNRKIQFDDPNGELLRRGTIVNNGPARCCIERFKEENPNAKGEPLYTIQRITFNK